MTWLVAVAALAALRGSLTLGDRSEARLRKDPSGTVVDLETSPSAALNVGSHRWDLNAAYLPRFTLRDLKTEETFQRGSLAFSSHDRTTTISVREEGGYGDQSFASLVLAQPDTHAPSAGAPPVNGVPSSVQTIRYATSRSSASVSIAPTRRWTYGILFEYLLSGGVRDGDRVFLPLQHGPRGQVSAEYLASRRDRIGTTVRAAHVDSASGLGVPTTQNTLLDAVEVWRRRLGRHTESTLSAGPTVVATRTGEEAISWYVYPFVEADVTHVTPRERVETRLNVRLAPVVDRLTGRADYRLQVLAAGSWSVVRGARPLLLHAQVAFTESVPPTKDDAVTVVLAEAGVAWRASRRVRFDLGGRSVWQKYHNVGTTPLAWALYTAATITLRQLTL